MMVNTTLKCKKEFKDKGRNGSKRNLDKDNKEFEIFKFMFLHKIKEIKHEK